MTTYITPSHAPITPGGSIYSIFSCGVSDGTFIPDGSIEVDIDISSDLSSLAVDMSGQIPKIIEMPAEIRQEMITTASAVLVRQQRDVLIAATDYLLMADYSITTEKLIEVKVYRQALRDITKQAGFPTVLEWPQLPLL